MLLSSRQQITVFWRSEREDGLVMKMDDAAQRLLLLVLSLLGFRKTESSTAPANNIVLHHPSLHPFIIRLIIRAQQASKYNILTYILQSIRPDHVYYTWCGLILCSTLVSTRFLTLTLRACRQSKTERFHSRIHKKNQLIHRLVVNLLKEVIGSRRRIQNFKYLDLSTTLLSKIDRVYA